MNTTALPMKSIVVRGNAVVPLNVFGVTVASLVGGAETGGACSVAHLICPPGAGAPPHRHAQAENFYVIRGQLTVRIGNESHGAGDGDFVYIPPSAPHAFQNTGKSDVEFLAVGIPGGHEEFFREADELARSGRFNPETAAELCTRHGIELLQ